MLKLDDLKQHYALVKSAHDAVKKQVMIDQAVYFESEKNLHEIEGKLSLLKALINKCGPDKDIPSTKPINKYLGRLKNGSKHS